MKLAAAVARFDSWMSSVLGLGTSSDKTQSYLPTPSPPMTDDEILGVYKDDPVGSLLVEIVPNEALRSGFDIEIGSDEKTGLEVEDTGDLAKRTNAECERLCVREKVRETAIWGRAFGAGYLIPMADDGLDVSTPRGIPSKILSLTVLDGRWVRAESTWTTSLASPNFGKPTIYNINLPGLSGGVGQIRIHHSRLYRLGGVLTPIDQQVVMLGRDWSVLERAKDSLRTYNLNLASAAQLLSDSGVGVYKVKGLFEIMASKQADKLIERVKNLDITRSVARSIMVDADEEGYERRTTSFSGLPEMLDKSMLIMAAAARIPVTILFGQSPAGMNATGVSDFRWFYDQIESYRENTLRPLIEDLIRQIWETWGVKEPTSWKVKFRPLVRPTEKEEAELKKLYADTDQIYITNQVVTPNEVALSRFGGGKFGTGMQIDEKTRKLEMASGFGATENVPPVDEAAPADTTATTPTDTAEAGVVATPAGVPVELAPTTVAKLMTANEARAKLGLGPAINPDGTPDPDGNLPIEAYAEKKSAQASAPPEPVTPPAPAPEPPTV